MTFTEMIMIAGFSLACFLAGMLLIGSSLLVVLSWMSDEEFEDFMERVLSSNDTLA